MHTTQILRKCSGPTLLSDIELILARNRQTAASHYLSNKSLNLEMSADPTLQFQTTAMIDAATLFGPKITEDVVSRDNCDEAKNHKHHNAHLQHDYRDHGNVIPKIDKSIMQLEMSTNSTLESRTNQLINPATSPCPSNSKEEGSSHSLGLTAKKHKRHIAQHHYRDHANVMPDVNKSTMKRKARGGVNVPFPIKLHEVLYEIEKDGLASVISWQPHGRAFVVHKPKQFIKCVLPKYFQQSKFKSFQRQLNRYGFSRLFSGKEKGGYYHELFLRGRPFLSEYMVRTMVKGTVVRGLSSPDTEPDFYSMPSVLPNPVAKDEEEATSEVEKMRTLDQMAFSNKAAALIM